MQSGGRDSKIRLLGSWTWRASRNFLWIGQQKRRIFSACMAALIAFCFKEVKEFCLTFKYPNASLSLKFILKITEPHYRDPGKSEMRSMRIYERNLISGRGRAGDSAETKSSSGPSHLPGSRSEFRPRSHKSNFFAFIESVVDFQACRIELPMRE
jgi:hypothetical protein